jgi:hypothetical protein
MKRADPHRALIRALLQRYAGLMVLSSRSEPWASVTFTGARHVLTCATGVKLEGLAETGFSLPGHIVADIAAHETDGRLIIEALTIEAD